MWRVGTASEPTEEQGKVMTPTIWEKLVQDVKKVLEELGFKFEMEFEAQIRLTPDSQGIVRDICNRGHFDTGTKKIFIARLAEKREYKGVEVTTPLNLDSFQKIAAFLVLHELGHKETGNGPEEDANEFARSHLDEVVSKLGNTSYPG